MTQQNASLVEETASASEEMSNQAQELLARMEQFKVRDDLYQGMYEKKHKEIHINTAAAGNRNGAGKQTNAKKSQNAAPKKVQSKAPAQHGKGDNTIENILTNEGFEEF